MKAFGGLYGIVNINSESKEESSNALSLAQILLKHKIPFLQIRAKTCSLEFQISLAKEIKKLRSNIQGKQKQSTLLIANDNPGLCQGAELDGLHVGQDDIPLADARKEIGLNKILGLSTHNKAQVKAAKHQESLLNYIACGPIFFTSTKAKPQPCIGLDGLREMSSLICLPVVAIGGITINDAQGVVQAGGTYIAVISELENAKNKREVIEHLQYKLRFKAN